MSFSAERILYSPTGPEAKFATLLHSRSIIRMPALDDRLRLARSSAPIRATTVKRAYGSDPVTTRASGLG
jgi:hypothetical protein